MHPHDIITLVQYIETVCFPIRAPPFDDRTRLFLYRRCGREFGLRGRADTSRQNQIITGKSDISNDVETSNYCENTHFKDRKTFLDRRWRATFKL